MRFFISAGEASGDAYGAELMRAAGPVKQDYPLLSSPELDQVQRLMRIAKSPVVKVRLGEMQVELYRQGR